MTERERFRRLFRGEPVDRPPLLEEGIRDEVIELWRVQGMPEGKSHLDLFGLTPHENIGPDIRFRSEYAGRIMDLPVEEYCQAFRASRKRFPEDWEETIRRLEHRNHIVCIWASRGFFQALGVSDWPTFEKVLLAVCERPEDVKRRIEIYGDFCARMLEMTLREVEPEFIYLSEPISDSNGPLISPEMFVEFMIPAYQKIVEVAGAGGAQNILLSTYGNTAALMPAMIDAGVNILWVSEAAETLDMDYVHLRMRYGPRLGLIGGIPLSILHSDAKREMRQRLSEIVPPLLQSGRFIPLASGRVRQEIPWSHYRRYREILSELMK